MIAMIILMSFIVVCITSVYLYCFIFNFYIIQSTIEENVCALGQFRCSNGQCISERLKCNAIKDCLDGSDEMTDDCMGMLNPFI